MGIVDSEPVVVGSDAVDAAWEVAWGVDWTESGSGVSASPEEQAANISAMAGTASQDSLQCSGLRNSFKGPDLWPKPGPNF